MAESGLKNNFFFDRCQEGLAEDLFASVLDKLFCDGPHPRM